MVGPILQMFTHGLLADVFNNLKGKYQKSNIVKALDRLTEQEVVVSKTYGKMTIYSIKQVYKDFYAHFLMSDQKVILLDI